MSPIVLRLLRRCAASAFLVSLGSCYYHDHDDDHEVVIPAFDVWEQEPNDTAWNPDPIGPIAVGESVVIGGYSSVVDDAFDGFAFQSVEPCDIRFKIVAQSAWTDLDLCVYDPFLGAIAFCFENPGNVEGGSFSVPGSFTDFHLVVSAYAGSSEYRLYVECVPITFGALSTPAHGQGERDRAVPLERYFERPADLEVVQRVVARGVYLEIEAATGEVREAPLELRVAED
jgi:hypothetical protein